MRAALAEFMFPDFELRNWRAFAGRWPQYAVMDAKCVHDAILNGSLPSGRRTALDVAVLKESMALSEDNCFVRWVPGPHMLSDGLTKTYNNRRLEAVMETGVWSLVEEDTVEEHGAEARAKRKARQIAPPRLEPCLEPGTTPSASEQWSRC